MSIEFKDSTRSKLAQKEIVVIKEVACCTVQELLSQKFTNFVFYMKLQEIYDCNELYDKIDVYNRGHRAT